MPSISRERLGEGLGHADPAGLQADQDQVLEPVVVLDDLVGHAPDRPPHVVGVHDLAPGNKNAPVGGRGASFAFGQRAASFLPSGPHGTRLTSDEDHSTGSARHHDGCRVGRRRTGR